MEGPATAWWGAGRLTPALTLPLTDHVAQFLSLSLHSQNGILTNAQRYCEEHLKQCVKHLTSAVGHGE